MISTGLNTKYRFPITALFICASAFVFYTNAFASNHEWANVSRARHAVGIVDSGHDALLIRLHMIRSARTTVDIQTFIWEDDASGRLIMLECLEAARRGVKVRFLMDHHFSSIDFEETLALAHSHPNLDVKRYRPPFNRIDPGKFRSLYHTAIYFRAKNQRMHTKVFITDNAVALTGGRNLSNHYFGLSTHRNYQDRDVLVAGEAVDKFTESFDEYWLHPRAVHLRDFKEIKKATGKGERGEWDPSFSEADRTLIDPFLDELSDTVAVEKRLATLMRPVEHLELTVDPPRKNGGKGMLALWNGSPTGDAYLAMLENAEESITIQSTYFIFNRKTKQLFRDIRKRHPDMQIRISTNSYESTGNMLSFAGTLRSRRTAVEKGMEFYELKAHPDEQTRYVPRFDELTTEGKNGTLKKPFTSIHGKSVVIDDEWSYVGSFNFDPRSINLNTEIGVIVRDRAFAATLKESIERDIRPGNSYIARKNKVPFHRINRMAEWVSFHLPVNLWPFPSTSSYEISDTASSTMADRDGLEDSYQSGSFLPGYELFSPKLAKLHVVYMFVWATNPLL
jgi:phosphatidylserine/phosphatidylglycerophosphate/cardiolipin synthase-like enzyme